MVPAMTVGLGYNAYLRRSFTLLATAVMPGVHSSMESPSSTSSSRITHSGFCSSGEPPADLRIVSPLWLGSSPTPSCSISIMSFSNWVFALLLCLLRLATRPVPKTAMQQNRNVPPRATASTTTKDWPASAISTTGYAVGSCGGVVVFAASTGSGCRATVYIPRPCVAAHATVLLTALTGPVRLTPSVVQAMASSSTRTQTTLYPATTGSHP
mmetsp:Transcript_68911/g.136333  ORF Transcript_68911/g.136333 Transcript_68911/m.136333 type:complete len:212 (-) Transcript_68911:1154-1789(-)